MKGSKLLTNVYPPKAPAGALPCGSTNGPTTCTAELGHNPSKHVSHGHDGLVVLRAWNEGDTYPPTLKKLDTSAVAKLIDEMFKRHYLPAIKQELDVVIYGDLGKGKTSVKLTEGKWYDDHALHIKTHDEFAKYYGVGAKALEGDLYEPIHATQTDLYNGQPWIPKPGDLVERVHVEHASHLTGKVGKVKKFYPARGQEPSQVLVLLQDGSTRHWYLKFCKPVQGPHLLKKEPNQKYTEDLIPAHTYEEFQAKYLPKPALTVKQQWLKSYTTWIRLKYPHLTIDTDVIENYGQDTVKFTAWDALKTSGNTVHEVTLSGQVMAMCPSPASFPWH